MDALDREMIVSRMAEGFVVLLKMARSLNLGIVYLYNIPFNILRMWLTVTQTRESKAMHDRGVAIMKCCVGLLGLP